MDKIAIIGFAGCYGGAEDEEEFWNKIINKQDFFIKGTPKDVKNYVNVYSVMKDIEFFDEEFFAMSPHEVKYTDPQQRVFLETCYRVLENTGYVDKKVKKRIGVFASASFNSYFINNILRDTETDSENINYGLLIGNDKDFLATRVSYKLNLIGPALTIQSACSSSMVGLNYACLSIERDECEAALVGGVSISFPQNEGYITRAEDNFSKDGICRPFDQNANGLVKGNGCSVIMIKKLSNAIRDRDKIYGIIENIHVNNDGSKKISFTAPSALSQSAVLKECGANEVDYIEAHGTGTKLGDPIELRAISQVYKNDNKTIPIGSVKADVGHLDVASGITSIVKVLYMFLNDIIPANKHLSELNKDLKKYERNFLFPSQDYSIKLSRIAISSFGIGGTNSHVILQKFESETNKIKLPIYFIPISYRRIEDIKNLNNVLTKILDQEIEFEDMAFSLAKRSNEFLNRSCYVTENKYTLRELLKNNGLGLHCYTDRKEFMQVEFSPCDIQYLLNVFYSEDLENYQKQWDEFLLCICPDTENLKTLYIIKEEKKTFSTINTLKKFYDLLEYLYLDKGSNINFVTLYKKTGWQQIKTYNYPLNKKKFWIEGKRKSREVNSENKLQTSYIDLEKTVLHIIKNTLEVYEISLEDDFYELGGDSLLAIDILEELKRKGIECKIQDLLDSSIIRDFVYTLKSREKIKNKKDDRGLNDYYKEILKCNIIQEGVVLLPSRKDTVLLLGATGFLGIHLLQELAHKTTISNIYCLIRGANVKDATGRLEQKLKRYFEESEVYRIREKITVICGDIVKENLGIDKEQYERLTKNIDLIINSAGIVKHYGKYEEFYKVNVQTVNNLLKLSKLSHAEYAHMSTLAISGNNGLESNYMPDGIKEFTEKDFDIGQPLENPYVRSKYEAEKLVLEAKQNGINAKIFRIGNLTNRKSDGVFQINFETDAFTQRILLLLKLKKFPLSLLKYKFEFTPIDEAAKAITSILEYQNDIFSVFHINNSSISGEDLCLQFEKIGFSLKKYEDLEFITQLQEAEISRNNPFIKEIILNDVRDNQLVYQNNYVYKNDFSRWYLSKLGFEWKETDSDYLSKYVSYFIKNIL